MRLALSSGPSLPADWPRFNVQTVTNEKGGPSVHR